MNIYTYLYICIFFNNNTIVSEKIIKNNNIPLCRNCKYYKPSIASNDFMSKLSICEKFGELDINTGKINDDFADLCRKDEDKCGRLGKYFEKQNYISSRIVSYNILSNLPYTIYISLITATILNYLKN